MNKYIHEMLKKGILIGGKISHVGQYVTFERLDLEELEKLNPSEIAFATHSMGRSVFFLDDEGKIINYKGVNSCLDNEKELSIQSLVQAKTTRIPNPQSNSNYFINLMITPNKKPQIRFNGASPLEDLEMEADINIKMQTFGIKLPQILKITEFTSEFAQEIGLPIKIPGNYNELTADYADTDKERKNNLHQIYGDNYFEELLDGYRPELMSEYFTRHQITNNSKFENFASENDKTIDNFLEAVDESYALGQRYGQAIRILESPFRIADLESYVKDKNIDAINTIVNFTQSTQKTTENFENIFARNIGCNCAKLMNAGWLCKNFVHRQDYTLTGEMCDDTYYYLIDELKHEKEKNNDKGVYESTKIELQKYFFAQINLFASTIKVLIDEMTLRNLSEKEKTSVIEDFITNFSNTIDFEKISKNLEMPLDEVYEKFKNYLCNTKDFVTDMAKQARNDPDEYPDGYKYDKDILIAHEGNNEFYQMIAKKISKQLNLEKNTITLQEIKACNPKTPNTKNDDNENDEPIQFDE